MSEQRIEKWQRWINDQIRPAVLTMFHHRALYQGIEEVIREHGNLPDSAFWPYHRALYGGSQSVAVRRQADLHPAAASLAKLIEELADEPTAITGDWWVGLWNEDPHDRQFAAHRWQTEYGVEDGGHLDPERARRDLNQLLQSAKPVTKYVDKFVAHSEYRGKEPAEVSLSYNDIHAAIDVIGELFRRYYALFTAADMVELVPVLQHDWLAPFRQPWIRYD